MAEEINLADDGLRKKSATAAGDGGELFESTDLKNQAIAMDAATDARYMQQQQATSTTESAV
jgi:hypothetical protein